MSAPSSLYNLQTWILLPIFFTLVPEDLRDTFWGSHSHLVLGILGGTSQAPCNFWGSLRELLPQLPAPPQGWAQRAAPHSVAWAECLPPGPTWGSCHSLCSLSLGLCSTCIPGRYLLHCCHLPPLHDALPSEPTERIFVWSLGSSSSVLYSPLFKGASR